MFNSIVSLVYGAEMLTSFYVSPREPRLYSPYLLDGSLLWLAILAAVLNIIPAKLIGKVNLRRLLFHHYVYGFLASSISILLVAFFAPAQLFLLLMPSLGFHAISLHNMPVYAALFFVYGGLTLVIDDISDVSWRFARFLDRLGTRARKSGRALQTLHLFSTLMSIYILTCGLLWCLENSAQLAGFPLRAVYHAVFLSSLLVTSVSGLKAVEGGLWSFHRKYELTRNMHAQKSWSQSPNGNLRDES